MFLQIATFLLLAYLVSKPAPQSKLEPVNCEHSGQESVMEDCYGPVK